MSAGVYEVAHEASGYLYVGASLDLERREFEWGLVFDRFRGRALPSGIRPNRPSFKLRMAILAVGAEGWTFEVVWVLPADVESAGKVLWDAECVVIEMGFERVGKRLLNSYYPGEAYPFGMRPRYYRM